MCAVVSKNVAARLDFKDIKLPKKSEHKKIAEELVRAIEKVFPRIHPGQSVQICFCDGLTHRKMANTLIPMFPGSSVFLMFLANEESPAP